MSSVVSSVASSPAAALAPAWIGQIIAASLTALAALVALFFTIRQNRALQRERLAGDVKLAEQKASADVALAERRFEFERHLIDHRRKVELAEQALALIYEAREVIVAARSPGMREGEGQTRKRPPLEPDDLAKRRDTYFVPIERLNREREVFGRLQALKYPFAAYFGADQAVPLHTMLQVQHEIASASAILIQMASSELRFGPRPDNNLTSTAFASGSDPDPIMVKVNQAVANMEEACESVLRKRLSD